MEKEEITINLEVHYKSNQLINLQHNEVYSTNSIRENDQVFHEIDKIIENFEDVCPSNNFSDFGGRIKISSVLTYYSTLLDKIVIISGWIRTIRILGKGEFLFAEINDGSCVKHLQIVINKNVHNFEELKKQGIGACVRIKGILIKSIGNKQNIELQLYDNSLHYVKILGLCDLDNYKLIKSKDKIKLENLREIAHLRPRANIIGCITRIRSNLALATHHFFQSLGFNYIQTPITTKINCEMDAELFQVTTLFEKQKSSLAENNEVEYTKDFFKVPTYLTCSGQLELESYACALCDVYSFGPTFRAEVQFTSRHLAEFWMVECEICFADLNDVMELSEKYLKFCLSYILKNNKKDLDYICNHYNNKLLENLNYILYTDFKKVSYSEAIEILIQASDKKKNLFTETVTWGIQFAPEHEKYLANEIFNSPVFVYHFPIRTKSFYMRINPDGETVASMDLLFPDIGEIIGGSQREEREYILTKTIEKEFKEEAQLLSKYIQLRKFGTIPHSGFGVGFDRLVMVATGVKDIKDAVPYPRYPDYSEF